jgi:methionyl-tRNA formyltransferase
MGTPAFAVPSLEALVRSGHTVVGVVTAADKPAGRGQKIAVSAVKSAALTHGIPVLQPTNLKSPEFIRELQSLGADLFVIVAFRMLPEIVWSMPPLGSFNLHGSLLPDYRGAAPINWAVMNGEQETGVTTFMLRHEIDTGAIIFQEKLPIGKDENVGSLHDRMMELGAALVVKTVNAIADGNCPTVDQESLLAGRSPKSAPKLNRDNTRISWSKAASTLHDHIRGLSPYPAAYSELVDSTNGKRIECKILRTEICLSDHHLKPGSIHTDNKQSLIVGTGHGELSILELQLAGKQRMMTPQLLNGFKPDGNWHFE